MTFLRKSLSAILICFFSLWTIAQGSKPPKTKKHRISFYGGFGPNYYFNNIVTFKDNVNSFNYSFTGRFMWEPGHLLSLGIESGYYRLYTVDVSQPSSAHIANTAIPIQLVISMKFLKSWYFNFNMGQSCLLNKVHATGYGDFNATTWSLSDFAGSIGYKYRLKNRISLGAETKFLYISSTNDKNIALLFMAGYNF
jgi:putative flippase GtrA